MDVADADEEEEEVEVAEAAPPVRRAVLYCVARRPEIPPKPGIAPE